MYFWISCLATGACISLLLRFFLGPAVSGVGAAGGPEHGLLKFAWPWILAVSLACRGFVPWRSRQALERAIGHAGLDAAVWLPERVVASQCLAAGTGFAAGWAASSALGSVTFAATAGSSAVAAAVCGVWPRLVLRERVVRRRRVMLREFPFLIDMTTLCVEAGLNLAGALELAARNCPDGPLRQELRHALADMRTGMPRLEALEALARRSGLPALRQWVTALAQADRLGMSLGPLLRAQSEQHRAERFLRAEKLALEAPVKMLLPMVTCIFPCTFLVIGFPIAIKLFGVTS